MTFTAAQKVQARKILNRAVATGRIAQQPCERCSSDKAQGHHEDYSQPLVVRWLCARCHSQLHNQKHPVTRPCVVCGKVFTPAPTKRARQLTCSGSCRARRLHQQNSRLTVDQMAAICARYSAGGVTQQQLADEHGVDRTRISQIVSGKASRIQEVNDAL